MVAIVLDGAAHQAALEVPALARGVVLFAQASGSSRMNARNRFLAMALRRAGLATLLFDLLTEIEDREPRGARFDVPLLARRLHAAVDWTACARTTADLAIGLFGEGTGAAAAVEVAAVDPAVAAVVSRGGLPDLAATTALAGIATPTLLIAGGADAEGIGRNEAAWKRMRCPKLLRIVPDATRLFAEPGALEAVASLTSDWFWRHLRAARNGMEAATFFPTLSESR